MSLRFLKTSLQSLVARTSLLTLPKESNNSVFITMTIDTEQDVNKEYRHIGTYKNINDGVPKILEIFDEFSAKATWLVTPDVAINKADEINEIAKESQEIGCHIHPEFFLAKSLDGVRPQKLISEYSYDEQDLMIRKATDIIEKHVGIKPTSFRSGRFGINLDTARSLENNGYLVDTSITPNIKWANGPDWSHYQLNSFFLTKRLLEIPVTIVRSVGACFWLRPSISDFTMLKFVARKAALSNKTMLLNLMFHSMETITPNPYVSPEIFLKRLKEFLQLMYLENAKWLTLSDSQMLFRSKANDDRLST